MEIVIDKILITEEAKSDYIDTVGYELPSKDIKSEVEAYIELLKSSRRFTSGRYFHVNYLDEDADKTVKLFFYKGETIGRMQMWNLAGVCLAEDWNEQIEESGQIRLWLKTSLNPKEETDWVWDLRVREEQKKRLNEFYEWDREIKTMVKELLKNYKLNKTKIKMGTADSELKKNMEFLDKCISSIDDLEREIIVGYYINGKSLTEVGKRFGYVKSAISTKRDRAVQMIEILFQDSF